MSETRNGIIDGGPQQVAGIIRQAQSLVRAGQIAQAERLCRELLAAQPGCFEALAFLGMLAHQDGRPRDADEMLAQAGAVRPGAADVHALRGLVLRALGREEDALAVLDTAVAIRPDYFEALFNRGNVLLALARYEEALDSFDRALALQPDDATALTHRGIALHELGRVEEALASHTRAVELAPDHAAALANRGNALRTLGRMDEARDTLERALAQRPDDANALANAAAALAELGQHGEAIERCDRALAAEPGHVEATRCKARALQALGRHEDALPLYRAAFAARGDAAGALGVGNALQALGRYEAALAAADEAVALEPELADAHNNRGNALRALGRHQEALGCYAQVVAREPDNVDAHWNEGLTHLTLGDFARGWPLYEWRTRGLSDAADSLLPGIPVWRGEEDLAGKTIVLHAEQGLGDAIQFVRYAPLVAERGARVLLTCRAPLVRLCDTIEGVDEVLTVEDRMPASEPAVTADCQALLMSLPLAFGTTLETIPAEVPYVAADPERIEHWRARLADHGAARNIGLAWRGNPEHRGARSRDCPIEQFDELLAVPDCAFFSLQLDEGAADIAAICARGQNVVDLAGDLGDFHETAAAICALDLVISVDTAVAHLAGALDQPAWLLLSYAADWRWLTDRDDSPWYPSLRLLRQSEPGNWRGLLRRVALELAESTAPGSRGAAT